MTELEGYIRYWEAILKETEILLDPSVRVILRGTIASLRKLQTLLNEPLEVEE